MYKCILIYYNVDDDVYVADGVDVVVDDDDGDDGDDDDGDDEGDDDDDGADDDSNEDDDGDDDDYDGDDDGGDDDDEEEDGERKMMMWMLRRKRKMMMMMLRRKTDPKTGKHTLCEPPQSKCTRTFHMSHFVWKFTGQVLYAKPATPVLCEPAQSKCIWAEAVQQFTKMPDPIPRQAFCARKVLHPPWNWP